MSARVEVSWRLKKGEERRIKEGHPWVYSNELQESPKGLPSGSPVKLLDSAGNFLAWGYGNAHSLIAARVMSRNKEQDPWKDWRSFLGARLSCAQLIREQSPLRGRSYRWVFGEADLLPGLVVDRFVLGEDKANEVVLVVQPHTAGAEAWTRSEISDNPPELLSLLKEISEQVLPLPTSIIVRRDMAIRAREGLASELPFWWPSRPNVENDLAFAPIRLAQVLDNQATIVLGADLVDGQKTGFFLDQWANIRGALSSVTMPESQVKILDLFSYVGQWSTQLGRQLIAEGKSVEVVCVDASEEALKRAQINLEKIGAKCRTIKADIFDLEAPEIEALGVFDWVILDPPALIKSKKDLNPGIKGYQNLNVKALSRVKQGGAFVSCSCSALLSDEEFQTILARATFKSGRELRFTGRGTPAPDHPWQASMSELRYLKAMWGRVW